MNRVRPLIESGGSRLEVELLKLAQEEAPAKDALERALLAVGSGAAVASVSTAAASVATAPVKVAAVQGILGISAGTIAKSALVGALVAAGAIGVVESPEWKGPASSESTRRAPSVVEVVPAGPKSGVAWQSEARSPRDEASPPWLVGNAATPGDLATPGTARPLPARPVAPIEQAPRGAGVTAPPSVVAPALVEAPRAPSNLDSPRDALPPDLASEIALLDGARAANAAQDPARALALLQTYDEKSDAKRLAPEAIYLRIEALAKLGQRDAAAALAQSFLAAHPRSPHERHIRALFSAETIR
jgi:hypothetical protein